MHVGRLHLEVCPLGWTDQALPQTHGSEAIQVRGLWSQLLEVRSPGPAPEEAHARVRKAPVVQLGIRAGSLKERLTQQGWAPSTVLMSTAPPSHGAWNQSRNKKEPFSFQPEGNPPSWSPRGRAAASTLAWGFSASGPEETDIGFPCSVLCRWKDVCSLYISRAGQTLGYQSLKGHLPQIDVREDLSSDDSSMAPPPPPNPLDKNFSSYLSKPEHTSSLLPASSTN